MAYSITSAGSPKALLAAIVAFASSQGWDVAYDQSAGIGAVGGQIALSSGNCHIAIGEQTATQNPVAVTGGLGPQNDGRLYMALAQSINPANQQYWGHPGSQVVGAANGNRQRINDVWGPMDEVHFFGNADYVIVAVRCSALRWTCFGFGNLDTMGLSTPSAGFCFSNFHEFWNTGSTQYSAYNLVSLNNSLLMDAGATDRARFFIPSGILDPAYGFEAGPLIVPESGGTLHNYVNWSTLGNYVGVLAGAQTLPMDHLTMMRNQPTTGGIALFSLPVMYRDLTSNLRCFLGQIPAIRAVRMTQNSPGDTVLYGVDEYVLFPWKQKGVVANTIYEGGIPNNQPNTYDLGWAILKD